MNPTHARRALMLEASNFSIFKYLSVDGFIVTAKNSGTHWLKYMLSLAMAHHYELPPPEHSSGPSSNDFLGHPKLARKYPELPHIAMSHSIPHRMFDWHLVRGLVSVPPFVVQVRDIRHVLVSVYEKWKPTYQTDFSTFLRGDPSGKRFRVDLWYYLRFFNRWGRVAERFPEATLVMRYEMLKAAPHEELSRIVRHLALPFSEDDIAFAVEGSSKDSMAERISPEGRPIDARFIREDSRDPLSWYSPEDMQFLEATLRENLRYDFGYGLNAAASNGGAAAGMKVTG